MRFQRPRCTYPDRAVPCRYRVRARQRVRAADVSSQVKVYVLNLSELLQRRSATLSAHSRFFETAERRSIRYDAICIDPHYSSLHGIRCAVRLANVARPDSGGKAIIAVVCLGDDIVEIVECKDTHHRAEDLFARHTGICRQIGEQGGTNKISRCEIAAQSDAGPTYVAAVASTGIAIVGN